MKLSFEANLAYQQEAIKSITDLFEGQPLEDSMIGFSLKARDSFLPTESLGTIFVFVCTIQINANMKLHLQTALTLFFSQQFSLWLFKLNSVQFSDVKEQMFHGDKS